MSSLGIMTTCPSSIPRLLRINSTST